jgi:hypothetical protein
VIVVCPLGDDALEVWYSARKGQAFFAWQVHRWPDGVRSLGTDVDIGAAALELLCFECRPFLLGQKSRLLVWYAASGPMCCVWGVSFSPVRVVSGPVWTSERRLRNSYALSRLFLLGQVSSTHVVRGLRADV